MTRTPIQEILPPMTQSRQPATHTTESGVMPALTRLLGQAVQVLLTGSQDTNSRVASVTIDIKLAAADKPLPAPMPKSAPPSIPASPPPSILKAETVKRIVSTHLHEKPSLFPGCYRNRLVYMDTHFDGTPVAVVEDPETGVRHNWTVCPVSFKPKRLGFANS